MRRHSPGGSSSRALCSRSQSSSSPTGTNQPSRSANRSSCNRMTGSTSPALTNPLPRWVATCRPRPLFPACPAPRSKQLFELGCVLDVRSREPPAHERASWVPVGKSRIDAREVELAEGQVPDVLDAFSCEVAPPVVRALHVAVVVVGRLVEPGGVGPPQDRVVESIDAPIQVFAIVGVIGMDARIVPEDFSEPLQGAKRARPRARFHCRAVERDLEATCLKLQNELPVVRVLEGLRLPVVRTPFRATHGPDRLGGEHPQVLQQAIDRPHIGFGGDVGVVDDRERESLAAGKGGGLHVIGRMTSRYERSQAAETP